MIYIKENGGLNSGRQISFIKVVVSHCSKLPCYPIETKTNELSLRKWQT